MDVNHTELKTQILRCNEVKRPLFIWGPVGIGKSQMAKEVFKGVAKEKNREFIEWAKADDEKKNDIEANPQKYLVFVDDRVALKDSTDNKGVPKIFDSEIYLKWIKTMVMNISSKKNSMVIWFKDELNLAPPMVQAAEYQIILDRALDDLSFAENTFVFAAGNRQEDRANVFELSDPLKNRMTHITLSCPSIDKWTDWALKNKIDSRIVGFLKFKRDFLFKNDVKAKSNAFATPRSWEIASDMISGIKDEAQIEMFLASAVGDGIASEFISWWRLSANVDIDALLKEPNKINEITQLDIKYVAIVGIVEKYKFNKDNVINPALDICLHLERNPELGALLIRMLKEQDIKYFMLNAHKYKDYDKLIAGYNKYMKD